MSFPYKTVLLVGATAGIGAALADRFIQEGVKVIAVGRRQDRLDAFVQKHGKEKASSMRFDISDRANIDKFVKEATTAHPEIDCVFLNAGTQNPMDLSKPESIDLDKFHSEIEINFSSFVDLSMKFLPFLQSKNGETSLVYTTSNLALVPAAGIPAYSISKAALNAFILCLRDALRDSTVKVIELSPPVVQTELHDYMGEDKGRAMGMPVDKFTDAAFKGLVSGNDQIVIGGFGNDGSFEDVIAKRRKLFDDLQTMVRSRH